MPTTTHLRVIYLSLSACRLIETNAINKKNIRFINVSLLKIFFSVLNLINKFNRYELICILGVNYEIDENLLLKDKTLSINENVFPEMSFRKYFRAQIYGVCEYFEIPKEVKITYYSDKTSLINL